MDYKEKLEEAKRLYKSANADQKYVLESLFPELKEPEDEGIIDAIKHGLKCLGWEHINGIRIVDILAWLEKQGETYTKRDVDDAWLKGMCDAKNELDKQSGTNVFDVPKISIKDAVEVTSRMQYIEDDMKPIAEFIMDYANWDLHKDEWNQPTLTVPLFRVLDALIQRGKPYCECSQNSEKQGEQKVDYTTLAETGNGGINALVTRELPTNGCGDEQNPADKAEPIVVRDFNSVFSREKVKEIDKRIEKSQKLYNAKLRDAMRKVEDFPMTD